MLTGSGELGVSCTHWIRCHTLRLALDGGRGERKKAMGEAGGWRLALLGELAPSQSGGVVPD